MYQQTETDTVKDVVKKNITRSTDVIIFFIFSLISIKVVGAEIKGEIRQFRAGFIEKTTTLTFVNK